MSTPETGDAALVRQAVDNAKTLLADREATEQQLSLLEPVSPEDVLEAREALGFGAGKLAVLAEARARRRGRPPGAKNKRTDDFAKWINGFGQHPAITLMQISSTDTEVLVGLSGKSYLECLDRRIRCAEALLPYLESKKPVAVDMTFSGVADLIIQGVTHSDGEIAEMLEGDFLPVDDHDLGDGE